jgi:hypothetical protein
VTLSIPVSCPNPVVTLPLAPGRYYAQWIEVDSAANVDRHACNCGHRSAWAPVGSGQLTLALTAHPATEDH